MGSKSVEGGDYPFAICWACWNSGDGIQSMVCFPLIIGDSAYRDTSRIKPASIFLSGSSPCWMG